MTNPDFELFIRLANLALLGLWYVRHRTIQKVAMEIIEKEELNGRIQ